MTRIWICGISKGEDGLYHCPYCSFTSDSLEDFATGMCWDCVYDESDAVPQEQGAGINEAIKGSEEQTECV